MKAKRILVLVMCIMLAAVLLAGCGGSGSGSGEAAAGSSAAAEAEGSAAAETGASGGYSVVYINALVTTPYFGYLDAAMEARAKELGISLQILDGKTDNQVMLDQAMSAIEQKPDAIIFTPADMAGSVSIVEAISDAGIPLVICNTRVDESVEPLTDSLICCDPGYEGEVIGKLAVEMAPEGGKCITLEGFPGQEAQIYRTEGFKKGIEGSAIEIVDQKICEWDKAKAMAATDDMITAHPDLAIVYAQDDTMAMGAIEAIKAAGKEDQIKVFGLGYMGDESKAALLSGELLGTCTQSPSWEGITTIEIAQKLIEGETVEEWYMTECLPVTKENCESIDHGYGA
ncbi:MAG: sugar ABC transporter substrate-binding protein [Clostridiales Family XIII bacterium]|jgi:ABC-type sugar transport system substrate-binding protein|nr:sugar ABC transporter substrate-binding protein [Clostridiales Family XIII bacterium]